jgi:chaperonin cofactor prefoldin
MGTGLSPYTKSQIIGDWLSGKRRKEISINRGISTGAVSNVVEEWRSRIGRSEFDPLRDLVLEWRKCGITAAECALGMRTINILKDLGINEDQIYRFINQIYDKCRYFDIPPDTIVDTARQVVGLVKEVPISEIPRYIQEKVQEKGKVDNEISQAMMEKSNAEAQLNITLKNNAITIQTLRSFIRTRDLLMNSHQIHIESDLSKVVNLINNSRLLGFDPNGIVSYLSNIADLEVKERQLLDSIGIAHDEHEMYKKSMEITYKEIEENNTLLETFNQLNSMGFGLEELVNIRNMASEFMVASHNYPCDSLEDKRYLVKMVLDRLRETQFLKKEVESLEKKNSMLQQEIVQQTEIYTKFMESAAEKAIERVVDYSKRAIQSICTEGLSEKQIEGSQTLSIVSNSKDSAPAASKVNQDTSSETKRMR